MPEWAGTPPDPFLSFDAGIDRENARTFLDRTLYGAYSLYNAYEDAVNVILQSGTSGKHPTSLAPETLLDPIITWPVSNLIYIAAYSLGTVSGGVLTPSTHLVLGRSDGSYWRYNTGSPGNNVLLRRGLTTSTLYRTDLVFDQWLVIFDGVDAPMKYGQHLNFGGQNEVRPLLFPVGSLPITPFVASTYQIAGEAWTLPGGSTFVLDNSVPGGGSRTGPESLFVAPSSTPLLTYTASLNGSSSTFQFRDLLNPPQPYTATPAFTGSDFFVFQYFKPSGTSTTVISFSTGDTTFTNNFAFTLTPVPGSWQTARFLRSAAVVTGSPDWTKVAAVKIVNNDTTFPIYLNDMYMLYANAPPAFKYGTVHKGRMLGGGVPTSGVALATLYWSNAAMPDYFPPANFQLMTSSQARLDQLNQITGLIEYAGTVIVGLPNAILNWDIGTDGNPVLATTTRTFGIDAHRSLIETPSGTLLFPFQSGFYALRATGRQYASANIQPYLTNVAVDPSWAVGVIHQQTKTLRYFLRQGSGTQTTLAPIFDYARSQEGGRAVWPSMGGEFYDYVVSVHVNGVEQVLGARYNSPQIFILNSGAAGATQASSITLPWMSKGGRDKLDKVIGAVIPISNSVPVQVFVRYAQHPGEFDTAPFELKETIQPTIGIPIPGPGNQVVAARVPIGRSSRWFQIKLVAANFGFEIFPPVEITQMETQKPA